LVLAGLCASVFAIPKLAVPQQAPSEKTMAAPSSGPLVEHVEQGKFAPKVHLAKQIAEPRLSFLFMNKRRSLDTHMVML
jgi:hypothetical protein